MANIGLIDVDGHKFPNLALMRISQWHKQQGDTVSWHWNWEHYDRVYMSKIFSDQYTQDVEEPLNADEVIRGGTGYAISLVDGIEVYDKNKDTCLPTAIEEMSPDYTIYPKYDFAVAMTSRGCPRGCSFCHVGSKEGRKTVKVADVDLFWRGQKEIRVLDPNITACKDKRDLFHQYAETGALINFTQGLDIRLINEDDIADLNRMRLSDLHFAWDNPDEDLTAKFQQYAQKAKNKPNGRFGTVYCLTNFGNYTEEEHLERALHRIYTLRDIGFYPYVMLYNKPNAPRKLRLLQRWVNNKIGFSVVKRFEDADFSRL